ncbi:MAG: EAL and HDOD domain-containing protein, partial [Leptospirillia bacterium]
MSEIFIGRQPIFDREVNVVAYELLYRDSMENRANITDFDQASSEMIFNALMEFGLDRLVGPHRAFINLTEGVLVGKQVESLPPDKVVLEVLESVGATAEVVAALESLIESGFSIALDDFVYQESLRPLVDRAEVI